MVDFSGSMIHFFVLQVVICSPCLGRQWILPRNVKLTSVFHNVSYVKKRCRVQTKFTTLNVDTLKKVLGLAKERFSYGNSTVKDFCERVESTSAEKLKENKFLAQNCKSNLGNIAKRDRAKA